MGRIEWDKHMKYRHPVYNKCSMFAKSINIITFIQKMHQSKVLILSSSQKWQSECHNSLNKYHNMSHSQPPELISMILLRSFQMPSTGMDRYVKIQSPPSNTSQFLSFRPRPLTLHREFNHLAWRLVGSWGAAVSGFPASDLRSSRFLPLHFQRAKTETGRCGVWSLLPLPGITQLFNFPLTITEHGVVLLSLLPTCPVIEGKEMTANDYNLCFCSKNTDVRYSSYCNPHRLPRLL